MKLALCLHGLSAGINRKGHPIRFELGYEYIKKFILNSYDVDVFIHTWNTENKEKLIEYYKPKKSIFYGANNYNLVTKNVVQANKKIYSMLSNLYSYSEVDKLRQKYEEEEKMIYDCVIHTRFDIFLNIKKGFEYYDMDKFYILDFTPLTI